MGIVAQRPRSADSAEVPSERIRNVRRMLLFLPTLLVLGSVAAAPLSAAARTEIEGLLSELAASSCEFNRNGTWYGADVARTHLLRKLKYLEDRDAVQTAEQFIERAASGSSVTGRPYLVRCGNAGAVPSETWLRARLQAMRVPKGAESSR
jgi:hypothetical protein